MISPVIVKRRGRKPGEETELIKKGRAAAAKKKENPEARTKTRSESAKKNGQSPVVNKAQATPEQIEAANKKKQKPALKPSQIAEMEALWESGEVTIKELAQRFNRDPSMVSRHMTLNNIIQGSRAEEYSRLIRDKIASELAGDAGENAKRIKTMKEQHLGYKNMIENMVLKEFQTMRAKNLPAQAILPNLRAIKEAYSIFNMTRSEGWALLGVVEFEQRVERDDIPELLISELTSEDIERMRIEQLQMASLTGESEPIDIEPLELDSDIVEEYE